MKNYYKDRGDDVKKILLTKNNYKEFVSKEKKEICIQENMILTSGAKDEIRRGGINTVYENEMTDVKKEESPSNKEAESPSNKKEVIASIEMILKQDYNILDEEKIQEVCGLILDKIQ